MHRRLVRLAHQQRRESVGHADKRIAQPAPKPGQAPAAAAGAKPGAGAASGAVAKPGEKKGNDEQDMLEQFLLDNL